VEVVKLCPILDISRKVGGTGYPGPKKGRISGNFRFGYRIRISEDFQLSANFTP